MRYNHIPYDGLDALSLKLKNESIKPEALSDEEIIKLVRESGLFDEQYYLAFYEDVKEAKMDPLLHFMTYGWKEGRNPNLWFETGFYLEDNPDISKDANPFLHFIFLGHSQKRRPNRHTLATRGRLIVSLSPEGRDYATIHACLHSLLNQTLKPHKIVMYLPRGKFQDKEFILNFVELIDNGIDIHWCEDWKKYSAIMPALQEYPDDIIVSCGCSHSYAPDFLASLYASYKKYPRQVHCARVYKAEREDGCLRYGFGRDDFYPDADYFNIPAAEYGMLVPPRIWGEKALNKNVFMRYASFTPALWHWVMSIVSRSPVRVVNGNRPMLIDNHASTLDRDMEPEIDMGIFNTEAINVLYYFKNEIKRETGLDFYNDIIMQNMKNLYAKQTGRILDINNCHDFNEKIQYLKLYDDTPIKKLLADKYLARNYIREMVGNKYLVKLLGVWNSFDDIDFSKLPEKFVLKTNHACATNLIVTNKNNFDTKDAKKIFDKWLAKNYGHSSYELNYLCIDPLIICEEYLGDNMTDYKFLCMDGEVKFCWIDVDRFGNHKRNIYSPDWILQDMRLDYPNTSYPISKPKQLPEMLNLASILSRQFHHSRVDFYIVGDDIKVGEITFYSMSGYFKFMPDETRFVLGKMIDLSKIQASRAS